MTQEEIHKYIELACKFNRLVENYYNEYLKNPYEEFSDWRWSPENSNEIIIICNFLNHYDEWEEDETYVTIEELSNFKPNDY